MAPNFSTTERTELWPKLVDTKSEGKGTEGCLNFFFIFASYSVRTLYSTFWLNGSSKWIFNPFRFSLSHKKVHFVCQHCTHISPFFISFRRTMIRHFSYYSLLSLQPTSPNQPCWISWGFYKVYHSFIHSFTSLLRWLSQN